MSVFLRAPYNYDTDQASLEAGFSSHEPTMAQQHFAEECDINTIVRRFKLTGELPQGAVVPTYADFEAAVDYHQAMNALRQAEESFMALPAEVRARFQNDPAQLVEFVSNDANRAEAVALGLVVGQAGGSLEGGSAAPAGEPAQSPT